MSLAYDLDFVAPQPPLALVAPLGAPRPTLLPPDRPARRPLDAPIALLRPLHDPAPLRLTRRGVAALAVVVAVVGLAMVVLGALSARSAGTSPERVGPAVVTVQAGDTLWSIASHAAPGRDPRAEIATIDRLNSLHGETLVPGQQLHLR